MFTQAVRPGQEEPGGCGRLSPHLNSFGAALSFKEQQREAPTSIPPLEVSKRQLLNQVMMSCHCSE